MQLQLISFHLHQGSYWTRMCIQYFVQSAWGRGAKGASGAAKGASGSAQGILWGSKGLLWGSKRCL